MNSQKDLLRLLTQKIERQQWVCLFTGMVAGIITHLYMLTNKLPNWDDITVFQGYGVGREHGRWFIPRIHSWGSDWSVPALNGMIMIIFLAIGACFILAALELKTVTSAVLLPVIMLTFPGVTSSMTFMYVTHVYGIGLCIGCIGAWLIQRFRYGFIPGIVLLILCLGTYQSFICLMAGVLVLALVFQLFRGKELSQVLKQGIVSLASLLVSMGLYVFISKYVIGGMSDYKGVSNMGQLELGKIPLQIARAYKRILEYFITDPWSFVSARGRELNLLIVGCIVAGFFLLLWRLRIYREKGRAALLCILIILFPLALSSIYILAPEANATTLTVYQYFMVYVVLIGFLELFMQTGELFAKAFWVKPIVGSLLMGMIFLVGYDNYVLANDAYFRMDIAFTRIHSFYERLYIRISDTEGYQYGDPIAILGDWWPERNILSAYGMDIERYEEFEGVAMENGLFTTHVRQYFMRDYLGVTHEEVSPEKISELFHSEEFGEMSEYPAEGCVRKIDGVWVIRVAD